MTTRFFLKTAALVVPLVGLAAFLRLAEPFDSDPACPTNLGFITAEEMINSQPGVVDIFHDSARRMAGCRFSWKGYADVRREGGFDRTPFEIVIAFDPATRQWQQTSLSMSR